MLGWLYGDLPPLSSDEEEKTINTNVWSSSTKMASTTLRKPASVFTTSTNVSAISKQTKTVNSYVSKTVTSTPMVVAPSPMIVDDVVQPYPALVGVQSTVIEVYDPARPNDYEEYRREKKRKAREAKIMKELEKRWQKET